MVSGRFSDDVWIGFFSELEKIAGSVDPKAINERLRSGSGPGWATAGALAGYTVGRKILRQNPRAWWPLALLSILPGVMAGRLMQRAYESGSSEEQLAQQLLARKRNAVPSA